MTYINGNTSKRRLSAKLAGGAGILALLALGAFAAPASAQWNSNPGYQQNSGGGYYPAPPVVYGSTYGNGYYGSPGYYSAPGYYAPPVVYGPSVGINLGGVGIGIR
jgi:hypothetical protein